MDAFVFVDGRFVRAHLDARIEQKKATNGSHIFCSAISCEFPLDAPLFRASIPGAGNGHAGYNVGIDRFDNPKLVSPFSTSCISPYSVSGVGYVRGSIEWIDTRVELSIFFIVCSE